jgi:hypothetical protein
MNWSRVKDPPTPLRWTLQGRTPARWPTLLLVAGVALAASVSGIRNHYAQDDVALIQEDSRVHSLDSLGQIFRSSYWPPPSVPDLYRPFATASFALQWVIGDGNPVVFRITSYLLYMAVSILVLLLARRLLPAGLALGAAVLFAAHPVHVEAVALAVNQGEQWVALFTLAAVIIYVDRRRRGWLTAGDWGLIGLLYALACPFKEHAVVLPGFLLASELTLFSGSPFRLAERVKRLWAGYAGVTAIGVAFLVLRTRILDDFVGSFTAEALVGQGIGGRTLTMLQVVPRWVGLLVWPSHLQGDYSPSVILQATSFGWPQALGAGVLAAAVVLAVLLWRRAPVVTFGILWMAVALLPVSNILIPTGIVLAERTLYLASAGFLLAVGGLIEVLLAGRSNPRPVRRFLTAACVVLVILGIWRSALRHPVWRNQVHYWAQTVEDAPLSYRAHHAHAQLLWGLGYEGGAIASFHTAMALYPRAWWIHNELANRFRLKGDCYPALDLYESSLRINPDQPAARASRIACLVFLGRYESAIAEADEALELSPGAEDFLAYRFTADSAHRIGAPAGSVRLTVPEAAELR